MDLVKKSLYCFLVFDLMTAFICFAKENKGIPNCRAELNDSVNTPLSKISWKKDFFQGEINGASSPVLITTSLGNNQIMSLWVREKKIKDFAGMFSFVDLSSGREQYMRFYMSDQYSVGVHCQWEPEQN